VSAYLRFADGAVYPRSDFHGKRWWWEPQFAGHDDGNKNGISNVTAPYDSLIGVFLEDDGPDRFKAPKHLDFKRLGLNFTSLAPELRQVFFIGTGATKDGVSRRYLVPKGATRLYLGIMDSAEWNNNSGSFVVTVKVERADVSSRISYAETTCPPNRNQCTPEKGIVEAKGPGEYHIVLPAQAEWGAPGFCVLPAGQGPPPFPARLSPLALDGTGRPYEKWQGTPDTAYSE
jgi:hypothetical protein